MKFKRYYKDITPGNFTGKGMKIIMLLMAQNFADSTGNSYLLLAIAVFHKIRLKVSRCKFCTHGQ